MPKLFLVCALVFCPILFTARPQTVPSELKFTDITDQAGVGQTGFSYTAAWGDYDRDGFTDLFVGYLDNNRVDHLYRNKGNGTFEEVAAKAGLLDGFGSANEGSAWADFDNDGDLDLVTANGCEPNPDYPTQFWRNNGNGTFTNIAREAGLEYKGKAMSTSWADYNRDGFVDLFVGMYAIEAKGDFLYRNNGNGTFTNVGEETRANDKRESNGGTAWADFDNDGDPDLYVANRGGANSLFRNDQGSFTEIGRAAGVDAVGNSEGVAWGDYDNDGWLDLYVADLDGPARLYRNNGNGTFTDVALKAHVDNTGLLTALTTESCLKCHTQTEIPTGTRAGAGVGANWADYDNDGLLDLFVANAFGTAPNRLYKNNGDGTFTDVASHVGVAFKADDRQGAWGDIDNDGFLDLIVTGLGRNRLYRNGGNGNQWLVIQPVGVVSNRDGIGARIEVTATIRGKRVKQTREVYAGGSRHSQDSLAAEFGLGDAKVADLTITYPSGIKRELKGVSAGRFLSISEVESHSTITTLTGTIGQSSDPALTRWNDASFPITWRLNGSRGANVTGSRSVAEVARQAFQTWQNVPTARVSFLEGPPTTVTNAALDGVNLVSVAPTVFNSDAPALTILYTASNPAPGQFPGQIIEADILFNPQKAFGTDTDLQSLLIHEIGHLLGLGDSGLASAAMFPTSAPMLSSDDVIGISNLYPAPGYFAERGTIHGVVRTPSGTPVAGAHVVVTDAAGKPVVGALTEADGSYFLRGIDAGSYSAYAEPFDQPAINNSFTTRFAGGPGAAPILSLTTTSGDSDQLEVTVRDGSGNPVPGVLVRFAATSGGGAVVPIRATTDAQGKARATAYVGKGASQAFNAFVGATSATFTLADRPVSIQLQPFLTGLTSPVLLTNARDGTNRKFVVEQPGRIRVVQSGSTQSTVFLDISNRILFGGEQGLLGVAFHPRFSTNGRFFVNYTRQPDGATVIAEFNISNSNETILLTIPQPYANHNGGMIEFGPDGLLYIGMGDGGSGNDPQDYAQNPTHLLGKMLRLNVDVTGTQPETFASGLRNPWRFSFDRASGRLYAADVGQGTREEVNIVTSGGNYGWRVFEGTLCTFLGPAPCTPSNFVAPIAEYSHSGGRCSITGGYVYRGWQAKLPHGAYVFGDFCTGEIFMLRDGVQSLLLDTSLNISSFGEDEAGELYVVDHNGSIYLIH